MITKADFAILDFIQKRARCKAFDCLMPKISMLGNFGLIWIMCSLGFVIFNEYKMISKKIVLGLLISTIFGNLFLKHVFARPRPCWIDNKNLLIKQPKDYSFPSCHTLSSVISSIIIIHASIVFGIFAVVLCLLIMFSRMYLYVHYPSDILGGVVVGGIIGALLI